VGDGLRRRDLFTFWRREAARATPTLLRPPGAVEEALFLDACQRCGRCVAVCPRQAIAPLDASAGAAAGTPVIRARQAPCVVCEGLQCTQVCPSGALTRVAVFDVQMGTAVVERGRCLTFRGDACRACVDACPVPGALVEQGGHPVVQEARCIGCGVCENVCPTPEASIVVGSARRIAEPAGGTVR
jgi:MauM/NapG family ferredoxin protein